MYFARCPGVRDARLAGYMFSRISLAEVCSSFITTTPLTRNTMATVFLNNQIFYTPPMVAGVTLTSHHALARNADVSAAISGAPSNPPPVQDAHDPRRGGPGDSPDDAFLISDSELNCDDSDNCDDGRSDATFPPPDELLTAPRNSVAATSACLTFLSLKWAIS